tara:strand:- start:1491 stop:1745 length:255 start_codon:yes stop_codon:yes gene_type:complete
MRLSSFTCGPFAKITQRIEEFGTGLYFSQLYYDTIMEHQQLELKLTEARKTQDDELIKSLEEKICFIENACQIEAMFDLPYTIN